MAGARGFEECMNEIRSPLGYFKCFLHSEMTAYYKAKLNKGGKEKSNRKKQKQDASPGRSDNQAKSRGAKALGLSSLPGPIATPLLRVPVLL